MLATPSRIHTDSLSNAHGHTVIADEFNAVRTDPGRHALRVGSLTVGVPLSVVFGTSSWLLRLAILGLALIGAGFVLTRLTRERALERA